MWFKKIRTVFQKWDNRFVMIIVNHQCERIYYDLGDGPLIRPVEDSPDCVNHCGESSPLWIGNSPRSGNMNLIEERKEIWRRGSKHSRSKISASDFSVLPSCPWCNKLWNIRQNWKFSQILLLPENLIIVMTTTTTTKRNVKHMIKWFKADPL